MKLLNLDERTDAEWRRKARDAVNGLIKLLADVGSTTERPEKPTTGQQRFNTTTGKPEWWSGTTWISW